MVSFLLSSRRRSPVALCREAERRTPAQVRDVSVLPYMCESRITWDYMSLSPFRDIVSFLPLPFPTVMQAWVEHYFTREPRHLPHPRDRVGRADDLSAARQSDGRPELGR
jgi:hypothetical protein